MTSEPSDLEQYSTDEDKRMFSGKVQAHFAFSPFLCVCVSKAVYHYMF